MADPLAPSSRRRARPAVRTYGTATLKAINATLRQEISVQRRLARALSESEARWRSLVANVPDFILTIDRHGKILFINRTLPELKPEHVIGSSLYGYIPLEFHKEVKASLRRVFSTGKIDRFVIKGDGPRQTTSWYASRVSPICRDGKIVGAVLVSTDITDRIYLEERIQRHQQELSRLSRVNSMAELATVMAHELNQPLGAINNFAKGCLRRLHSKGMTQEEITRFAEHVSAQATRAGHIIQRVKNAVKKEGLNQSPCHINTVIQDTLHLMDIKKNREIKLEYRLGSCLPEVRIDRIQVEQVIINLVQNAMDALAFPAIKNGRIAIETSFAPLHGVCVSISDNGGGIPEGVKEKIFDPFFSTKREGMGIGLSLCRSIVEAHNGKLSIRDNRPAGSVFSFTLPVA